MHAQAALGGTAAVSGGTAFIATVGPSPLNAGESLSTLLFAERCMRVKHGALPGNATVTNFTAFQYCMQCAQTLLLLIDAGAQSPVP
jgi:hypothetical protein